jgi:hypothetical protein
MPPGLLLQFMCHGLGGTWARRHRPGATATQFHVSVVAKICSSLSISDPAVRANAFRSWTEKVGDDAISSASPNADSAAEQGPSSALSDESFALEASRKLKWVHEYANGENDCAVAEPRTAGGQMKQLQDTGHVVKGANADAIPGTSISREADSKVSERVWGESLQLGSRRDADLLMQQLQLNMAEGIRYERCFQVPADTFTSCKPVVLYVNSVS